jgi:hypothetical protein
LGGGLKGRLKARGRKGRFDQKGLDGDGLDEGRLDNGGFDGDIFEYGRA